MLEKKNKYNFVLNSQINNILTKKFFSNRIKKDYKATAYTAILDHKKINNYTAVQIFTKYGPLAFLPFSKNKTSIVFSVQRNFGLKLNQIKDEILKYSKTYNIEKIFDLETFNLEYLKNEQVRIRKSFSGKISDSVNTLLTADAPEGLGTKKELEIDPTLKP